jgi:hypothetical protein
VSCSPIAPDAATTFRMTGRTVEDVDCIRVSPP